MTWFLEVAHILPIYANKWGGLRLFGGVEGVESGAIGFSGLNGGDLVVENGIGMR